MKVIALLLGLAGLVLGIISIVNLQSQRNSTAGRISYGISEKFRNDYNKEQNLAIGFIVGGAFLFILGVSSSSKPKTVEHSIVPVTTPSNESRNSEAITQLERLAKLKEQGVIDEEGFQKQKNKIIG